MNRPTTGYTEKGNGRSALFAAAKAALLCENGQNANNAKSLLTQPTKCGKVSNENKAEQHSVLTGSHRRAVRSIPQKLHSLCCEDSLWLLSADGNRRLRFHF